MKDQGPKTPRTIWTVGHSNHPLDQFLDLLGRHEIAVLVDVRSSPYSRYASHFNREAIQAALQARDVKYLFLGDLLGGRADGEQFYDEKGHVLYDRVAQSPDFSRGIERLIDGVATYRVALMCGEEDPTNSSDVPWTFTKRGKSFARAVCRRSWDRTARALSNCPDGP